MKKINSKEDKYSISFEPGGYTEPNKIYMTVPYEMDSKFIQMLKKLSVSYEQIDEVEALYTDNIINRMIVPKPYGNEENILKSVNVEKLDAELKKNPYYCVGRNGENGINVRYEKFKNFLKTNQSILSPILKIEKSSTGEIRTYFSDGRHRYAVLRDLGIKDMPVCIDKESLKYAGEIGLI